MSTSSSDMGTTYSKENAIGGDIFAGMQPAFKHAITGEAHLAQSTPGVPSTAYAFVGLPDAWVAERDDDGNAIALHPDIVPGYWRDAQFIGLTDLPSLPLDG